jgi:hypothetical protein
VRVGGGKWDFFLFFTMVQSGKRKMWAIQWTAGLQILAGVRHRSRSAVLISRLKNTVGWFVVREKYYSNWKNKLKRHIISRMNRAIFSTGGPKWPKIARYKVWGSKGALLCKLFSRGCSSARSWAAFSTAHGQPASHVASGTARSGARSFLPASFFLL